MGLLYAFLLLNSSSPVLSLGLYYAVSSFLGSFHCFRAPLSHFILLGILSPFHHFRAPLSHFILLGTLEPFHRFRAPLSHFIFLGILGPFHHFQVPLSHSGSFVPFYSFGHPRSIPILYSHGPLLSLLGFPDSNYHILYFLGLWAFHQPLTHLIQYFGPLWLILTFLHDILLIGLLFLSPGSFRPIFFLKVHLFILWVYDPLFLPFKLNGFLLNLLILFFPYCWASSCYWAPLPKWALTLPSFKGIVNDDDVCILLFFIIPLLISWFAPWKFLVILDFCNGTHFFMSVAICILISLCFCSSMYSFLCFCRNEYSFFCFCKICRHFLLQYMHLFLCINAHFTLLLLEQHLYCRK